MTYSHPFVVESSIVPSDPEARRTLTWSGLSSLTAVRNSDKMPSVSGVKETRQSCGGLPRIFKWKVSREYGPGAEWTWRDWRGCRCGSDSSVPSACTFQSPPSCGPCSMPTETRRISGDPYHFDVRRRLHRRHSSGGLHRKTRTAIDVISAMESSEKHQYNGGTGSPASGIPSFV
jgi:hypothetical protein